MKLLGLLVFLAAVACCSAARPPLEQNDPYVLTPFGRMLRSSVHQVPSGSNVKHNEDGSLEVTVPGTPFRTTIPSVKSLGSPLPLFDRTRPPRSRRSLEQFPADYDGWLQYTAFHNENGFDQFLGNFSVPDEPKNTPDMLYIFTGLQNIDWIPIVDNEPSQPFDIIQPVLQYPGDYDNYWSVKSWYVTLDAGALYSEEIKVSPGDVIFGNMTRTGDDSWYIGSTVVSTGKTTVQKVTNSRLKSQPWAYNTLECYGCTDCSTFPTKPCVFSNLVLSRSGEGIEPVWQANPKPSKNHMCNEKVTIADQEDVTFSFQ